MIPDRSKLCYLSFSPPVSSRKLLTNPFKPLRSLDVSQSRVLSDDDSREVSSFCREPNHSVPTPAISRTWSSNSVENEHNSGELIYNNVVKK